MTRKRITAAVVALLVLAGATSIMAYPARVSPEKAENIARELHPAGVIRPGRRDIDLRKSQTPLDFPFLLL